MERAVQAFPGVVSEIIIDGVDVPQGLKDKGRAMVKADQHVPQVSAASVIAKVWRDRLMTSWSEVYAGYGFEGHKGYPTAMHRSAIMQQGLSRIHRRSFCRGL
jgi:ribonuclease HII